MNIRYSELESKRFGLRIYRGQYEEFDTTDLDRTVAEDDFDIIIVRYPTPSIYEHYKLSFYENCRTIHADSLLYYSAPLDKIEVKPLVNDLKFDIVTPDDKEFDAVVESIFTGYKNHYFANPFLDRKGMVEGYSEWAKSFAANRENGITWLVRERSTNVGVAFQACYFDEKESICDLKLGGVVPTFFKRGIYADILRFSQDYFKKMGIRTMITSTQLQNAAVRRSWIKHGFSFDKSYETYHIINDRVWKKNR